jgi:hypothetical protein
MEHVLPFSPQNGHETAKNCWLFEAAYFNRSRKAQKMLKGDAGSGADTGAYIHTGQQRTQGDAEISCLFFLTRRHNVNFIVLEGLCSPNYYKSGCCGTYQNTNCVSRLTIYYWDYLQAVRPASLIYYCCYCFQVKDEAVNVILLHAGRSIGPESPV